MPGWMCDKIPSIIPYQVNPMNPYTDTDAREILTLIEKLYRARDGQFPFAPFSFATKKQWTGLKFRVKNGSPQPWTLKGPDNRPINSDRQLPATLDMAKHMIRNGLGMYVYPADFECSVLDFDQGNPRPVVKTLAPGYQACYGSASHVSGTKPNSAHFWYPWNTHLTPGSRAFKYGNPRTTTKVQFNCLDEQFTVDWISHNHGIKIPPEKVHHFLTQVSRPRETGRMPFPVLAMCLLGSSDGGRNNSAYTFLRADSEWYGYDRIDREAWSLAMTYMGLEDTEIQDLLDRACRGSLGDEPRPTPSGVIEYPVTRTGFSAILHDALDQGYFDLQYNVQSQVLEYKHNRDAEWEVMSRNTSLLVLLGDIHERYRATSGGPWEGSRKIGEIITWLGALTHKPQFRYDPLNDYFDRVMSDDVEPAPDDDTLLFDILSVPEPLRPAVHELWKFLELVWWSRLYRLRHANAATIMTQLLPVLFGPAGIGKSSYLRGLGAIDTLETASLSVEAPPKMYRRIRDTAIAELEDMHRYLAHTKGYRGEKEFSLAAKEKLEYLNQMLSNDTLKYEEKYEVHAPKRRLNGLLTGTTNEYLQACQLPGMDRRIIHISVSERPEWMAAGDGMADNGRIIDHVQTRLPAFLKRAHLRYLSGDHASGFTRDHIKALNQEPTITDFDESNDEPAPVDSD